MKTLRLFYGLMSVLIVLTVSESSAGDDGYVQTDENGKTIVPVPRVRKRQMPRIPKLQAVADPGTGFDNPPKPIKPLPRQIVRESDESRIARNEQKVKDAEAKSLIRARLKQLNNLRHQSGLPVMSGEGCKAGVCKFPHPDGSKKVTCTGSQESFLIDNSPGFTCGGSVCFLSATTGKMECEFQSPPIVADSPVAVPAAGQPFAPAGPACQMVDGVVTCENNNANCVIDHARGIHMCPTQDDPRRDRRPANTNVAI